MRRSEDASPREQGREELNRQERELRKLFQEAHRDDAQPPPFQTFWNRVRGEATPRHRPPRGPRLVVAGAVAVLLLALVIVWALREPALHPAPPSPGPLVAEAAWERTWAGWEGPLDFLLDSPGRTYLESVPALLDEETFREGSPTEETFSPWERSTFDAL